ncbi:MAG: HTH domain-containing protein, partial [Vicinamibacteria bacterium]
FIHLTARNHTTQSLAEALGVSKATAFRVVKALRARGVNVKSAKKGTEWYFDVDDEKELELDWKGDPFRRLIGFVRGRARSRGTTVDELVYRKK